MASKATPMPAGWRGRVKKGGGSSQIETRHYEEHPPIVEMHKRNKMEKKVKELTKMHPEYKYSIQEVTNRGGNLIKVIKKAKREV